MHADLDSKFSNPLHCCWGSSWTRDFKRVRSYGRESTQIMFHSWNHFVCVMTPWTHTRKWVWFLLPIVLLVPNQTMQMGCSYSAWWFSFELLPWFSSYKLPLPNFIDGFGLLCIYRILLYMYHTRAHSNPSLSIISCGMLSLHYFRTYLRNARSCLTGPRIYIVSLNIISGPLRSWSVSVCMSFPKEVFIHLSAHRADIVLPLRNLP